MQIPKNETLWVHGHNDQGELRYIITSTKLRDVYFLYLYKDGKFEKKLRSNTPEKFKKYTEIGEGLNAV